MAGESMLPLLPRLTRLQENNQPKMNMKKTSFIKGLYESPELKEIVILHRETFCGSGTPEAFIVDSDDDVEF